MPYLMTDVAAGSSAANQLMQNMGEAPYAVQEGAAKGQESLLKLKEEQIRVQQDQANVEKTKLANMMTDSQITMDKRKQEAIAQLEKTAGWAQFPPDEKMERMGITIMPFDSPDGERMIAAAAAARLKDQQAESKRLDNFREQIGTAEAVMQGKSPEEAVKLFESLPPETKRPVIDKVGKVAWDKMTPKEKQDTVHRLMENGNQKIKEIQIAASIEAAKIRAEEQIKKEEMHDNAIKAARDARDGRATNMWAQANKELDTLRRDPDRVKMREQLDKEVKDAKSEYDSTTGVTILGYDTGIKGDSRRQKASDKYLEALRNQSDYLAKEYDQEEEIIQTIPPEKQELKDLMLRRIRNQKATLYQGKPTADNKGSTGLIKPTPAKDVPSNTAPDKSAGSLQDQVEAAGMDYEPDQYDYRVVPDVTIQRKKKK